MGNQSESNRRNLPDFLYGCREYDDFASWFRKEIAKNSTERVGYSTEQIAAVQGNEQMKGIGQNFDDFMIEQGLYEEAQELATKRIIALQLEEEMKKQNISKSAMAEKMHTSRSAVDNVLDFTHNTSIGILERFATALGKKVQINLV